MNRVCHRLSAVYASLVLTALFATSTAAAPATEVLVTTAAFGDIEFDWGRDGVYCPTCNFGAGNARFNWVDHNNRLWVANVDFATGGFYPPDGHGVLVDTSAAFWSDFHNGPEWAFSAAGSQLVYTRYTPGQPITTANTGIGLAQMINGAWSAGFVDGGLGRILPVPTQTIGDAQARMAYGNGSTVDVYWRKVVAGPSPEVYMPWGNQNSGAALRWVPGTGKIVFAGLARPNSNGAVYQQVFSYDTGTGVEQQLTFDATQKRVAFMFPAPEFGGDMVFFTVADRTHLNIYRDLPDSHGVLHWTLINSITAPAGTPYMDSPEPFFLNGHTWVFLLLSSQPSNDATNNTIPADIALTGIDPAQPSFRMLTDQSSPVRLRHDPEYFITANGPYIYYSRAIPGTSTSGPVHEGEYRVDTGLGPPVH